LCVAKVLGKRVIFPRPLQISCSSLFGKWPRSFQWQLWWHTFFGPATLLWVLVSKEQIHIRMVIALGTQQENDWKHEILYSWQKRMIYNDIN
jgi:hypothetical protein